MAWSKLSRQERGYGAAWDKVRKVVLARDCGLCQVCAKAARVTPAKAVDHIVSKAKGEKLQWSQARIDDPSNLQSICDPCHAAKSLKEEGKSEARAAIGADGWPVDSKKPSVARTTTMRQSSTTSSRYPMVAGTATAILSAHAASVTTVRPADRSGNYYSSGSRAPECQEDGSDSHPMVNR